MASEGSVTFSGWLRRVGYWFTWWPWRCLVVHWWQRRTRGFDDRVMWDLGNELVRWLAPRLQELANQVGGAPYGYPYRGPYEEEVDDRGERPTDFEGWKRDIERAATNLAAYAAAQDAYDYDAEVAATGPARESMLWVATWWEALWD